MQILGPTHHSDIELNPSQPTTVAKKFDPAQPNPTMGGLDMFVGPVFKTQPNPSSCWYTNVYTAGVSK